MIPLGSTNSFQETYQKYYRIFQCDWSPYVKANNLYTDSEKLVAFCTRECAEQAEKAANYALLAAHFVREGLKCKSRNT